MPEGARLLGEYLNPVVGEIFVVEQDEEHVEQGDERCNDADDQTGGVSEETEHLRHSLLQTISKVLAAEELLYCLLVSLQPFLYGARYAIDVCRCLYVLRDEASQLLELLYHGRDDEIDHQAYHGNDGNERDNDAQCSRGDMHTILHKLHGGVEQIGQEPGNEEGQQHVAEVVHGSKHKDDQRCHACPTNELVECYLFLHRDC